MMIAEIKITNEPMNIQNSLDDADSSFCIEGRSVFMFTTNKTNAATGEIIAKAGCTNAINKREPAATPDQVSFLINPFEDKITGNQKNE